MCGGGMQSGSGWPQMTSQPQMNFGYGRPYNPYGQFGQAGAMQTTQMGQTGAMPLNYAPPKSDPSGSEIFPTRPHPTFTGGSTGALPMSDPSYTGPMPQQNRPFPETPPAPGMARHPTTGQWHWPAGSQQPRDYGQQQQAAPPQANPLAPKASSGPHGQPPWQSPANTYLAGPTAAFLGMANGPPTDPRMMFHQQSGQYQLVPGYNGYTGR